jgi:hypothetical protein
MRLGKGSVCENWLHENCTMFSKTWTDCGASTVLTILRNVRNQQRSKESHRDTEHRLFYFITLLFTINFFIMYYMWDIFHHAYTKDALLRIFVICYCSQ